MALPIIILASFSGSNLSECASIIGTVFDDLNRNGLKDAAEPGIPDVGLMTAQGLRVVTDAHGRYHIDCADMPDRRLGANTIIKLDERTLPWGHELTSENPRVVRLTAGKMTRVDFGALPAHVVRVTARDYDFVPGRAQLTARAVAELEPLIAVLKKQRSVVEILYLGSPNALVSARTRSLRNIIIRRWRRAGAPYKLEFQIRIESSD